MSREADGEDDPCARGISSLWTLGFGGCTWPMVRYLPPYTSFLPAKENDQYDLQPHDQRRKKRRGKLMENLIFSQLSYLTVFIILVCITERKRLKEDPLNFNVLNIVLEVISTFRTWHQHISPDFVLVMEYRNT
ncbi:hypothetical protein ACLB2K_040668 [Fragaria x ananassa]